MTLNALVTVDSMGRPVNVSSTVPFTLMRKINIKWEKYQNINSIALNETDCADYRKILRQFDFVCIKVTLCCGCEMIIMVLRI